MKGSFLISSPESISTNLRWPNNFVKATPVFAILLVVSQVPGAPYDNRYA